MFTALVLGFTLFGCVFGEPGISNNGQSGSWIADNSSKLEINGNRLSCDDGFCSAMWLDENCFSSGEHYWRIHFESDLLLMAVKLTNEETFLEDIESGDNMHQEVKSGDTAEILASFSPGKLKAYFGNNNQSLVQLFDSNDKNISVCPAIKFYGPGKIKITKERELPPLTIRKDLINIEGIEGQWIAYRENIKLGEKVYDGPSFISNSRKSLATLTIERISKSTIGGYRLQLNVINSHSVRIRMGEGSWRSITQGAHTLMGGPMEIMMFESLMSNLVENPDSVKIISGNLILQKENLTVTFVR